MSSTRSVASVANTLTAPPDPAGTTAAFALMRPSTEFSVETKGCWGPVGRIVIWPGAPLGTTVTLSAYARAVPGIAQEEDGIAKLRSTPDDREGLPNCPRFSRVSAIRHGDTGT